MNLQYRINLLSRLGDYMVSDDPTWLAAKISAAEENGWFTPEFIDHSIQNLHKAFLNKELLENWALHYPADNLTSRSIGLVMAGNIPMVGFHDLLCCFICGHNVIMKASSKDKVLISTLVKKLIEWEPGLQNSLLFADRLKGCEAYIATGSNNSSRYFDYYFGKYPNIIRRNRTSAAVLTGKESNQDLENLADDVFVYFGLGCRSVTKIYVPEGYDFIPLITAFKKYTYLADHHKFKNNYDYNLAIHLLNKVAYMTNGSILLIENDSLFSPISQLNYSYYNDKKMTIDFLEKSDDVQCIIEKDHIPFGRSQAPCLADYADNRDTMEFLTGLG